MRLLNRFILSLFLLVFLGISYSHGQEYLQTVEVKLKNTSVIKGYTLEPWLGGNINIIVSDKTKLTIDSADIRKIKLVKVKNGERYIAANKRSSLGMNGLKSGFYHHIFAGISFGEEELNGSLGIINGYRFNKFFAIGLGVNYDRFSSTSALPIYLQPRLYVRNEKASLYYFMDLGYSPAWENDKNTTSLETRDIKGGLMGQAGVGYQINFFKSALNFTLG